MIASTMRLRTRAVSAMVSPRPSWVVPASMISEVPPSWRIAMSKDTRVRVEFFSKIMASVRPASGASRSGAPLGSSSATRSALPVHRAVEHRGDGIGAGVGQIEEMPGHAAVSGTL